MERLLTKIIDRIVSLFRTEKVNEAHNLNIKNEDRVIKTWTVWVRDNFHYMDEDETWKRGEYENYDLALSTCKQMVDQCLYEYLPNCKTSDELYRYYQSFGDDPYIIPDDPNNRFSAWSYAQNKSNEIFQIK